MFPNISAEGSMNVSDKSDSIKKVGIKKVEVK